MTKIINRKVALSLFGITLLANTALARSDGDFTCFERAGLDDATANTDQLKINNFSARETKNSMKGSTNSLEISYSIANRTQTQIYASADFVAYDGEKKLVAAINASPGSGYDSVKPGQTVSVSGSTFVNEGSLSKITELCMRVYAVAKK